MFVYLLECSDGQTYVGATVDLSRRLRQHNGEIKGGAKRTTSRIAKGHVWKRVCYVSQFPDWTAALQFEWRWKQLSRKYSSNIKPVEKRIRALHDLLTLSQSTSNAISFEQWTHVPIVHVEEYYVEVCSCYLIPDSYEVQ